MERGEQAGIAAGRAASDHHHDRVSAAKVLCQLSLLGCCRISDSYSPTKNHRRKDSSQLVAVGAIRT